MGLIEDINDIEPIEPDYLKILGPHVIYGPYLIVDEDMYLKTYIDYASTNITVNITAPEFDPKDFLIDGCSHN